MAEPVVRRKINHATLIATCKRWLPITILQKTLVNLTNAYAITDFHCIALKSGCADWKARLSGSGESMTIPLRKHRFTELVMTVARIALMQTARAFRVTSSAGRFQAVMTACSSVQ
jgi:hypothetical protein